MFLKRAVWRRAFLQNEFLLATSADRGAKHCDTGRGAVAFDLANVALHPSPGEGADREFARRSPRTNSEIIADRRTVDLGN